MLHVCILYLPFNVFERVIQQFLFCIHLIQITASGMIFGELCKTARRPSIHGLDMKQELMSCGHDLFIDRGRLKSTFVVANLLQDSDVWDKLKGGFDIIFAASVFHPRLGEADENREIARQAPA